MINFGEFCAIGAFGVGYYMYVTRGNDVAAANIV